MLITERDDVWGWLLMFSAENNRGLDWTRRLYQFGGENIGKNVEEINTSLNGFKYL